MRIGRGVDSSGVAFHSVMESPKACLPMLAGRLGRIARASGANELAGRDIHTVHRKPRVKLKARRPGSAVTTSSQLVVA